jgi:hypothetical protein
VIGECVIIEVGLHKGKRGVVKSQSIDIVDGLTFLKKISLPERSTKKDVSAEAPQ